MNKYDAAGDVRQKNYFLRTSVVVLVFGAVLLILGIIMIGKNGLDKYVKTYSDEFTINGGDITDLDLSFGAAEVTIGKSDDEDIHIVSKDIPYKLYQRTERKRLFVYDNESNKFNMNTLMSSFGSKKQGTIEVLLPEKEYNLVELELGISKAKINDLNCKKFDLEVGMSDIKINGLTCSEKAELDLGMCDIDLMDCTFAGKSDIDAGMTNLDFTGEIKDDMVLDLGMADAKLNIKGSREDYNLKGDAKAKGDNNKNGITINADKGASDLDIKFVD